MEYILENVYLKWLNVCFICMFNYIDLIFMSINELFFYLILSNDLRI